MDYRYSGYETMVQCINLLNGFEDKFVIPNVSPFRAIALIRKRAIPEHTKGVGYYFYETTKGFYFQSWENMCAEKGTIARPPVQQFFYVPQNITDEAIEDKTLHDLQSVESYKFLNTSHDVVAAQALGTYGHKVISYNLYDKSFNTTSFHYHDMFNETIHADFDDDEKWLIVSENRPQTMNWLVFTPKNDE